MRLLVTGATGFIGSALAPALRSDGHDVLTPDRAVLGDVGPDTAWVRWLEGVDAVVHLAGLAHAKQTPDALNRVNMLGARALAEQASAAGVKRFVLMSSVKAAVDQGGEGALTEDDPPKPTTPYGRSKLAAEQAVTAAFGAAAIALRPPLVHGPRARANFALLMRLAASPLPLPFGGLANRRSLISVDSLVDAVRAILAQPVARGGAYFVADRPALSVAEIVTALRQGLGRPPTLFSAPVAPIAPAALRESLVVDDSRFRAAFAFEGRDSRAALAATAAAWNTRP